jgi:hypothetical protein
MWEKKGRGAFQGETAEAVGPADMLNMFSAGIASLLEVGATPEHDGIGEVPAKDHYFYGDMYVKDARGKRITISDMRGFPDDFVLYEGKGYKVTMGDARADIAKDSVRDTRDDKPLKNARSPENPEGETRKPPKRATDKLETADIPTATLTELAAEHTRLSDLLLSDEFARLHSERANATPTGRIERSNRMKAIREHFGKDAWKLDNTRAMSKDIREATQKKVDLVIEAGARARGDGVAGREVAVQVRKRKNGIAPADKATGGRLATTFIRGKDKPEDSLRKESKNTSKDTATEDSATQGVMQVVIISRDNNGNIFNRNTARGYAGAKDRVVKRAGHWVIERDTGLKVERTTNHLSENEEMAASAAKEHDNKERTFDEETG